MNVERGGQPEVVARNSFVKAVQPEHVSRSIFANFLLLALFGPSEPQKERKNKGTELSKFCMGSFVQVDDLDALDVLASEALRLAARTTPSWEPASALVAVQHSNLRRNENWWFIVWQICDLYKL